MRMAARDRVGAVIDQPPRELSLSIAHSLGVLLAPMYKDQNERRLASRFSDRRSDARPVSCGRNQGLVRRLARVVERNHCGFGPGPGGKEVRGVGGSFARTE